MGNSLRCCLACVLPCGALDLIRIVHLNGYVEEITRPITAGEILQTYPNHVLSKPCSQANNNMVSKIMILSHESELKRGNIYFLLPNSSLPSNNNSKSKKSYSKNNIKGVTKSSHISKSKVSNDDGDHNNSCSLIPYSPLSNSFLDGKNNVVVCETKVKSKSKYGKHQRRRSSRGKSGIWQPHLESINEDL